MKKVAIVQSDYIPWKGYFDIINMVDIFVFYDDVQYTVRDWRNRNKIRTHSGVKWLSIPCGSDRNRLVCEVELKDSAWQQEHFSKIENAYRKAPFFSEFKKFFQEIYLDKEWSNLSEFNQFVIKKISREILGIYKTVFKDSREYDCKEKKLLKILGILDKIEDVGEYITGPAARNYLVDEEFEKRGIKLTYMDYGGYPEYPQLYAPPFVHEVSILDVIFNTGYDTIKCIKNFNKEAAK